MKKNAPNPAAVIGVGWTSWVVFESHPTMFNRVYVRTKRMTRPHLQVGLLEKVQIVAFVAWERTLSRYKV